MKFRMVVTRVDSFEKGTGKFDAQQKEFMEKTHERVTFEPVAGAEGESAISELHATVTDAAAFGKLAPGASVVVDITAAK